MVGIGHCKENVECIISFMGITPTDARPMNFKHFLRVPLFILSV